MKKDVLAFFPNSFSMCKANKIETVAISVMRSDVYGACILAAFIKHRIGRIHIGTYCINITLL